MFEEHITNERGSHKYCITESAEDDVIIEDIYANEEIWIPKELIPALIKTLQKFI